MKALKKTAWSVYLFTLIRLLSPIEQAWADVKPGDMITQTTLTQAEALLPASIRWMVEQGMSMDIRQTKPVVLPHAYTQATQQHAGQVKLANTGRTLVNYVAGLPFPTIDLNESLAAVQIMWNTQLPPMDNFGATFTINLINRKGGLERSYAIPIRWAKGIGRLYLDPKPSVPHTSLLLATAVLGPTLLYRYLSPDMLDTAYVHNPTLPRPLFLPHIDWHQPAHGSDFDLESTFGFSGKLGDWTFRVLTEREILAVVHSGKYGDPSQWCSPRDGSHGILAALPCVAWEKRRVWVIEAIPTDYPQHAYSKRILYIDQDFFGVVLMEMYDQASQLWKVYLPCFSYAKQPYQGYPKHPLDGARYQYTDEWPFMPSSVVVDMQKRHATTLETPSSTQQPSEWQSEMYFNEPVADTVSQASWLTFLNQNNRSN